MVSSIAGACHVKQDLGGNPDASLLDYFYPSFLDDLVFFFLDLYISPTLTEWDPKWFRLFVSDVSNDCTEKVLTEAFEKYASFKKVKVVKDRLSNKVQSLKPCTTPEIEFIPETVEMLAFGVLFTLRSG